MVKSKQTKNKNPIPLTFQDYKRILQHYGKSIPKTKSGYPSLRKTRKTAERLLSQKLCSCIKTMEAKKYPIDASSAICKNSILNRNNLTISRFTCKNKHTLYPRALSRNKTQKIMKTDKIYYTSS